MSFQQWVTLGGICCTIVVTVTTWGFLTGKWSTKQTQNADRLEEMFKRLSLDMNRRFDKAGEETSKAMTYIQGMESRFLREFATRELTDERFKQNAIDHKRAFSAIEKLERRVYVRRDSDRHQGED